MRVKVFVFILAIGILGSFLVRATAQNNLEPIANSVGASSAAANKIKRYDPRITPQYLDLLKKQADERNEFFRSQAQLKDELTKKHLAEREELVSKHRAARKNFSNESHPRDQRAAFFKSQRDEMASLEAHQKSELQTLEAEIARKVSHQHGLQRRTRDTLARELIKAHQ